MEVPGKVLERGITQVGEGLTDNQGQTIRVHLAVAPYLEQEHVCFACTDAGYQGREALCAEQEMILERRYLNLHVIYLPF